MTPSPAICPIPAVTRTVRASACGSPSSATSSTCREGCTVRLAIPQACRQQPGAKAARPASVLHQQHRVGISVGVRITTGRAAAERPGKLLRSQAGSRVRKCGRRASRKGPRRSGWMARCCTSEPHGARTPVEYLSSILSPCSWPRLPAARGVDRRLRAGGYE
jgi:hypothetical protein